MSCIWTVISTRKECLKGTASGGKLGITSGSGESDCPRESLSSSALLLARDLQPATSQKAASQHFSLILLGNLAKMQTLIQQVWAVA